MSTTSSRTEATPMTVPVMAERALHVAAQSACTTGDVVVYRRDSGDRAAHDHATSAQIARRLAALKGYRFAGEHDGAGASGTRRYVVPTSTLVGVEHARALGIGCEEDLFGGVVPHPFVGTKSISHPLVAVDAAAPCGWSRAFSDDVGGAVLAGFSAFSLADAMRAGRELLLRGPVRVKRALGIGGNGQVVVQDSQSLERTLAGVDADEVRGYGIGLEQDLTDVTTYSVGQVRVDGRVASYCGTQCLTRNNHGDMVYGGSTLLVARGDFDALLALDHAPAARHAVAQARVYDEAAFRCFAGLFASRRNYDVAAGVDALGCLCSGVLEQSWRVGGASGAEVEALIAFRDDPALAAVHASTTERYGDGMIAPRGAVVYFEGTDERAGPLLKFASVAPHVHAR
jgi:hypothetical protein